MKKIISGLIIIMVIVLGYFLYTKQLKSVTQARDSSIAILGSKDKQELETAVFSVIEQQTGGAWDKRIDISRVEVSQNAVEGWWWNKDRWDWIAWRQSGGEWKILVSKDGFNCNSLDSIPPLYVGFFHDDIYRSSGAKYCSLNTQ